MVSENIKKQFVEFIKLQGFDDQYIDRQEEKKILNVGVKNGLSVEASLALITEIAQEQNLVLERDAEERVKTALEQAATNDGQVDKKEFEQAIELFRTATKGKLLDAELKKRAKQIMLDNGWKAKEGGLFGTKWFSAID
ncbi:MAG: hypothetical protein SVR94_04230 [Pseudomonadota bacterium]|nr:hypothetical protein [Pseudomonadota bacterium]